LTEYHLRTSLGLNNQINERYSSAFSLLSDYYNFSYEELSDMALKNWTFDKIRGNNPKNWQTNIEDLDEFINQTLNSP